MTNGSTKRMKNRFLSLSVFSVASMFIGLILWSIYFPLEIRVIAPAEVTGDQDIVEIRALSSGVVRKIHVTSGQKVNVADVLVELDDQELTRQIEISNDKLDISRCRLENLRSEIQLLSDNSILLREIISQLKSGKLDVLIDFEAPCLNDSDLHRTRQLADNLRLRQIQAENLLQDIQNLETQIELTEVQLASIDNDVSSRSELAEQKVISEAQLRAVQREYTSAKIILADHKNRQSTFKGRVAEIKAQANVDVSTHIASLANDIRVGQIRESDEASRLSNYEERLTERTIYSPIEGTVIDINSFVISNFAQQSELLLKLAPRSTFNLLKASVAAEDIDNIKVDGNASVRFPTYATLRDSLFTAHIRTINPIKTKDEKSGRNEENSFEVILEISDDRFAENGQVLQSGTPAEILFAAESTTFAKALIRPIAQNWPKIFEQ